ncbi:G-protein coupled receptor moody-like [Ylistrum balloti]|uniref:G-protein coupled receptor moody-like n=1 Tax=Ylistrum balloti TaxID=509963 RepID=UPI0029059B81|nr:G-protein coupled receptor moody-like [Ylistrum balloti]
MYFRTISNITTDVEELVSVNQPQHNAYLWVVITMIVIIIFMGFIGNVMVIVVVKTTKKLQTVSNYFIINLSISDLIFVCCVLPFNIYTFITDGWYMEETLCKFIGFMGYMLTGTTIITVVLIAYNRYKLVTDMMGYRRLYSKTNIAAMITLSWTLPVIFLIPAITELWGKFGYVPMMVTCNLLLDHNSQMFKIFLLIVRAGIPCGLIVYFYIKIYMTTYNSSKRILSNMRLLAPMDTNNLRREMHLTKMMVVIFLVFAISYFPCTITGLIDWNHIMSKTFHMFCATTVYIGSALNPLLYGLFNQQFRDAYIKLLCRNKQNAPIPVKH